jgi:ferredoxin-NADP reductase/uncharacterized protein YcbX
MAILSGIFIYPVKSLDGAPADVADVLASGALAQDRRFALVDSLGQYVNGKRHPSIHGLRSSYDARTKTLRLSSDAGRTWKRFAIDADREPLQRWLSDYFGFAVSMRENRDLGFPDDTDSPGPTLISTATLAAVADWFGLTLQQTRARFRTNLEIDGVPPFWEDRLYGPKGTTVRFRIGDLLFDGINPCQRCVVPARDAVTGRDFEDFARRFVELRRRHLPEWAEPSRFNHFYRLAINTRLVGAARRLRAGDALTVIGRTGTAVPPAPARPQRWTGKLRVTHVIEESPDVRTFRLAAADGGELPFDFLPGQYLTLHTVVGDVQRRRSYTIASSPTRRDACELTIKVHTEGIVSRHLHERIRCGDLLDASGPDGRFIFTGGEAEGVVLIGAGVGITPLMSKVRYLTDRRWPGRIDLVYSVRTAADIVFRAELASLAARFPNLRVTTTLTGERSADPSLSHGRIDANLLLRAVPDLASRRVHFCGPVAMAADLRRVLGELGVPGDRFFSEAFGGPRSATPLGTDQRRQVGTISFAGTPHAAPGWSDGTLLEAADAVGVAVDHGCLAGICGRCKVRLVAGEVDMPVDDGLTEADKADGYVLACQARPLGDVVVATG